MVNPSRIAFSIFGRPIYWYGVLMALGIACAVFIAIIEARRKKVDEDVVLDMCLVAIPSGVIGSRLYYVLFELERYLQDPIRIFYIWEGGLAIYGAVLGGVIGALIFARVKKMRFLALADLVAPGLVLAQAIGRWGNFFNQEAFGLPVENPDMLWFPFAVKIDGAHYFDFGDGLGPVLCSNPFHLATFFYESMWCLIVFAFLWFFLRKRVKHDGDLLIWYAMLYSFERMFLEGLRGDSLWLINGVVRVSQLLSFIMFALAASFLIVRHIREKKLGTLIWPNMDHVVVEETPKDEDEGDDLPDDTEEGLGAELPAQSEQSSGGESGEDIGEAAQTEQTGEAADISDDTEQFTI